MRPAGYVETTIPSYLTAWVSRDLIRAAHQQITRERWARREEFELYASRLVVKECAAGDAQAARERLAALAEIPLLEQTPAVAELAEALIRGVPLPTKAAADSLHIATAAVHGMQYLLTWNCTHIANVALRPRIEAVCRAAGLSRRSSAHLRNYGQNQRGQAMIEDEVIRAVRAAREAYAASHNFDVRAMVEDLRESDATGDWSVVNHPPRPVQPPRTPAPMSPNQGLQTDRAARGG